MDKKIQRKKSNSQINTHNIEVNYKIKTKKPGRKSTKRSLSKNNQYYNSNLKIKGINVNCGSIKKMVDSFYYAGYQATNLSRAVRIIEQMRKDKAKIYLTFTSNMVSSGLREVFAYLCEKKFVDVIITGAGSIEEDLMKTKNDFLLGDFHLDDHDLHHKGMNRIGNILVPNKCYEELEDQLIPFFKRMLKIQEKENKLLSPTRLINELGKTIKDKNSFLYWASKNNIPIFCPALTDGAFGLQVFFFKQKYPKFGIDITDDMKKLADITLFAKKTGGIILGGGFAKHHAIGVNILREGMDYSVYISTGTQYDGSMSGARNHEAISWSKLKEESNSVFVEGDATIIFSLIINSINLEK